MARIMCALAVLFFAATALAASAPPSPQEKVQVTVYYESLCPDSKKFISEQLKPTYSNFSSYMNLTLVPFGKSTYNSTTEGKFEFMCHHGEPECYGNKVQACALKLLPVDKQVDYIACLMSLSSNKTSNSSYPGNSCAQTISIDYSPIEGCVNSDQGSELLAVYGDKTHAFQNPLQHVPTVAFNNKYVMEEHDLAVKNFKAALCNKITGTKPAECPTGNSAITFNPGYVPLVIVSTITILSRL